MVQWVNNVNPFGSTQPVNPFEEQLILSPPANKCVVIPTITLIQEMVGGDSEGPPPLKASVGKDCENVIDFHLLGENIEMIKW